jgi:hypothetical protein
VRQTILDDRAVAEADGCCARRREALRVLSNVGGTTRHAGEGDPVLAVVRFDDDDAFRECAPQSIDVPVRELVGIGLRPGRPVAESIAQASSNAGCEHLGKTVAIEAVGDQRRAVRRGGRTCAASHRTRKRGPSSGTPNVSRNPITANSRSWSGRPGELLAR